MKSCCSMSDEKIYLCFVTKKMACNGGVTMLCPSVYIFSAILKYVSYMAKCVEGSICHFFEKN